MLALLHPCRTPFSGTAVSALLGGRAGKDTQEFPTVAHQLSVGGVSRFHSAER